MKLPVLRRSISLCALAAAALALSACMSTDPYTGEQKVSNTAKGAGIGAVTGAVLGAAVSKDDRSKGAAIGAAVGAGAGAGVGFYMDKQEAELRRQLEGTGVRVQRVGDQINLIMPGNITFDVDQDSIKSGFYPVLDSVGLVLVKFKDTGINVRGYTDSTGSFEYNQRLSERRAASVGSYLISKQIASARVRTTGFGPRDPVASNDSAAGREQNRRVEVNLYPLQK